MSSTVSREILKSYSCSDSALSRPDRTLRKWDVISQGTPSILAMKSFSLSLDDQMVSSLALISCFLSLYPFHALWSLMESIPYLRTCCNSYRTKFVVTSPNQRHVRHFSFNFFFQLWLKSQVSSLVIRFPWNRLVDTVSSLFVCHVASSLRTMVLIRLITMITSMHLTLDAASSCVGIAILFREVVLLVVLTLLRHVFIFEFELIDSRWQSGSRYFFHSSISVHLYWVVCALFLSF